MSLLASLARLRAARKSLDPMGAARDRARKAMDALRATKAVDASGPVAEAGGAPDPTAGSLTDGAFAGAGALPPGIGRRRRLAGVKTLGEAKKADAYVTVSSDEAKLPASLPIRSTFDELEEPIPLIFQGLAIAIDRPAGFTQVRFNDQGKELWRRTYSTNYGYLPGTCGGDEEELDVFVGPDATSEEVWWFYIQDDAGSFDEFKLVIGVFGQEAAQAIIAAHIPPAFVAPGVCYTTIQQVKALVGQDPRERSAVLDLVGKSLDRVERSNFAIKSVLKAAYDGAKPLPAELAQHPALTAKPTETYPNPQEVGGWLYVIDGGDWIAFVDTAGKALLWTERDESGGVVGAPYEFRRDDLIKPTEAAKPAPAVAEKRFRIISTEQSTAKAAPEERYILGVVLEPEVTDLQGEVYSAEVIRESAFKWLGAMRNVDLEHKLFINEKVSIVESYIAPLDFEIGGQSVKAGTWLLGLVCEDQELWAAIKRGELTGFSINGLSRGEPV